MSEILTSPMQNIQNNRVNKITGLFEKAISDKPDFSLAIIEKLDMDEFREIREFSLEEYWCDEDSINIFEVSGTRHPDYYGMTWLELLENGKRMKLNLSLFESNPGYYLEDMRKFPSMSYVKLDGKTYVDADGNHRTCIAKFYFYYTGRTNLHGVTVKEYITDRYTYNAFRNLKELLKEKRLFHIEVSPFREKLSREDTAGWMREHFKVGIKVRNKRTTVEKIFFGDDVFRLLNRVSSFNIIKKVAPFNDIDRFLK